MIEGIQKVVTIPVMAKCRIGHFAEAQVLAVARRRLRRRVGGAHPGRRGAPRRQVGVHRAVRVRRDQPRRGAAAHRRGRGTDPLEGRGRHRQHRRGGAPPPLDPRRHQHARRPPGPRSSTAGRRSCARRSTSCRRSPSAASCPVPLFCAGGIATPADAALVMQLGAQSVFVGSGIFKSSDPAEARPRRSSRPPRTTPTPTSSRRCRAVSARRCPARRSTSST